MTNPDQARPGGHQTGHAAEPVQVWDPALRLFHWLLVLTVFGCWLTEVLGVAWMDWHMWLGYVALGLILFRLLWGFLGPAHARFTSFLKGPVEVSRYLRGWAGGRPETYAGHNPAAGWTIVLTLASVGVQAVTGLFNSDDILTQGPWRSAVPAEFADLMGKVHAVNANVLWGLIGLHIAALLAHRLIAGERLVGAMITGRKPAQPTPDGRPAEPVRVWRAVIAASVVAAGMMLLVGLAPEPDPDSLDFF